MSRPNARAGVAGMVTIELEDHGQDFLEWDIDLESMKVVDCRPYQGWVWVGTTVGNSALRRGNKLRIRTKNSNYFTRLRYPIASVGPVSMKRILLPSGGQS